MIPLEGQILIAFLVDALVGDPRWLPHPVRGMGWVARLSERFFRSVLAAPAQPVAEALATAPASGTATTNLQQPGRAPSAGCEYAAGWLSVVATLTIVVGLAVLALAAAGRAHPLAADLIGIYIVYSCIALRDLCAHAQRVYHALTAGSLPEARRCVSMMVGRDTDRLDASGVAKATVESVAENCVDGVTAPLLYAVLLGPLGALAYRVINTLDSMFGYRNVRYQRFGWTAARLDDCANYLPARLSAPLLALGAAATGASVRSALRILLRDGRKHSSPNAGLPEAAMAGALRIQLGGTNHYFGAAMEKPMIGDPERRVSAPDITRANRIVMISSMLFLAFALSTRAVLCSRWLVKSEMRPGHRAAAARIAEEMP